MKRFVASILILGTLLFTFQNCGKAGFENEEFTDQLSTAQEVDPKLANLPFPYQISVNQIAHMSCPLNVSNPSVSSPYFSWKVGAFDNPADVPTSKLNIRPAGLQLSSQFVKGWTQVAASYSSTVQPQKLQEALTTLPSVANTQLQMSFRKTTNPATDLMQMPASGDSPTVNFMPMISTSAVADAFKTATTTPQNLFPNALEFSERFLETSLIVPSIYGNNDWALRANYDASYLAIGFAKKAEGATEASTVLVGPSTDTRFAYGKGYRVHFGVANPHTGTTLYPPSDSLSVVEENELETGYATSGVSWDCSYKFKIVRPQDRYMPYYRTNHFGLVNGQCPTPAVVTDYCASPIDSRFGIHPSFFPNGVCPSNRNLVKNGSHCEERYAEVCPSEPYAARPTFFRQFEREDGVYSANYPNRPAILHALRRFLPANQWDINVSRKCIVPKFDDNACYANPPVYDEYFFSATQANPNLGQYTGCGVNGQFQCAAYLTLCIRR
ncbi:MAG: hypothetical protein ACAH59_01980 [Pseudobdellovibrionaceae bacterium]